MVEGEWVAAMEINRKLFFNFFSENFFYMQVEFRQLFCLSADKFFIPLSLLIMNELAHIGMVSYAK